MDKLHTSPFSNTAIDDVWPQAMDMVLFVPIREFTFLGAPWLVLIPEPT
jgi:hypothetical protein